MDDFQRSLLCDIWEATKDGEALTKWERDFVESIEDVSLTQAQSDKLTDIYEKYVREQCPQLKK